ncbi:MAG: hypothetical protein H0W72_01230 [Planctomycetes bacterium]|nr:hypothetical protein [Planctomycetota bacterium]
MSMPSNDPVEQMNLLFLRHAQAIRGFIVCLVAGDQGLADDVFQEVFLVVSRRAADFRPDGDFTAWVRGIARNKLLAVLRQRRRGFALSEDVLELLAAEAPSDDAWDRHQRAIRTCLDGLAPRARANWPICASPRNSSPRRSPSACIGRSTRSTSPCRACVASCAIAANVAWRPNGDRRATLRCAARRLARPGGRNSRIRTQRPAAQRPLGACALLQRDAGRCRDPRGAQGRVDPRAHRPPAPIGTTAPAPSAPQRCRPVCRRRDRRHPDRRHRPDDRVQPRPAQRDTGRGADRRRPTHRIERRGRR